MPTQEVATLGTAEPTGQFTDPQREAHKAAILEWVGQGKTVRAYCRQPNTPHFTTVYDWLNTDETFALRFARSRQVGEQAISEDCLEIADEMPPAVENGATDSGYVSWQKNRVWTRLQLLAKWNPKKWGDKIEQTHNGSLTLEQLLNKADAKIAKEADSPGHE